VKLPEYHGHRIEPAWLGVPELVERMGLGVGRIPGEERGVVLFRSLEAAGIVN